MGGLARESCELDADRVRVAAPRVPRDIVLADALNHGLRVDAVVRRHPRHAGREPAGADHRRAGALGDLHRVHHDDVERPSRRLGLVRALDEAIGHAVGRG